MRELFALHGDNEEAIVREYAAAEKRGEVLRDWMGYKSSPEMWAKWLLKHGRETG